MPDNVLTIRLEDDADDDRPVLPPASGGSDSGAKAAGRDPETYHRHLADLAKSLGYSTKELFQNAHQPIVRNLLDQLGPPPPPTTPNAPSEPTSVTPPQTGPAEARINEVLDRFRTGLLTVDEAMDRLTRLSRQDTVVDFLRDKGQTGDPLDVLRKMLHEAAGGPTLAKPGEPVVTLNDLDPTEKRISEVLERFRKRLLSADEALERLNKAASGASSLDYLRDKYGPGTDPKTILKELLNQTARESGQAGLPPESSLTELKDLLKRVQPLLRHLPGVGRLLDLASQADQVSGGKLSDLVAEQAAKYANQFRSPAPPPTTSALPTPPPATTASGVSGGGGGGGGGPVAGAAGAAGEGEGAAAAAGEGAAMAGLGELAAVAGPAAIALLALKVGSDRVAGAYDTMRRHVESAGQQMQRLAGNDYLGMFQASTEQAAQTVEQIPILGKIYASEIRFATAAVRAYTDTVNAFVKRGQELQGLNASLAAANAQADVRRLMSDIHEAERTGESIGRLIDAQSQIESDFREIMLPLKELIAEVLASVTEGVAETTSLLKEVKPLLQISADAAKFIIKLDSAGLLTVLKLLNWVLDSSWIRRLAGAPPKSQSDDDLNEIMKNVLGLGGHSLPAAANAPDPTATAAQQRLGIPILSDY